MYEEVCELTITIHVVNGELYVHNTCICMHYMYMYIILLCILYYMYLYMYIICVCILYYMLCILYYMYMCISISVLYIMCMYGILYVPRLKSSLGPP